MDSPILASTNDRDMLIRLDQKLDGVVNQIIEVKECLRSKVDTERVRDMESRISRLADVKNVEEIASRSATNEKRIDSLERKAWMAAGALVALEFVLKLVKG